MAKLDAQQAKQLAGNFLAIGQAIGNFRYKNHNSLSPSENKKIADLHWSILNYADDLLTLSATIIMDDVEASLDAIRKVTTKMQATYKKLENIDLGIKIATKVFTLGAAILSRNPSAIAASLDDLINAGASEA